MTITMLDSINVNVLPTGDYAYAGYINGRWPTYPALVRLFPHALGLSITVSASADADCLDVENGDATPVDAVEWVVRRLAAGAVRPCIYANTSTLRPALNAILAAAGSRDAVRLWSAHYGAGRHICGPLSCGQLPMPADGTQWTSEDNLLNVDVSELEDDFFTPQPVPEPVPEWETTIMNVLPILEEGSSDKSGSTFFVYRAQALISTIGLITGLRAAASVTPDGVYGPSTKAGVQALQNHFRLTPDGIIGSGTWSALITGAP